MFGIGTTEVLLILAVALLVIGPSKLPEVAKALGKGMAEFKKMSSDVKKTIDFETQLADMEEDRDQKDAFTGGQNKNRQKENRKEGFSEEEAVDRVHLADDDLDWTQGQQEESDNLQQKKEEEKSNSRRSLKDV